MPASRTRFAPRRCRTGRADRGGRPPCHAGADRKGGCRAGRHGGPVDSGDGIAHAAILSEAGPRRNSDRARAEHPFGRSGYWAVPLGTSNMADRPAEGCAAGRRRGADGRSSTWAADVLAKRLRKRSCPSDAGRRREPAAPGTFAARTPSSTPSAIHCSLTNSAGAPARSPTRRAEVLFSNAGGTERRPAPGGRAQQHVPLGGALADCRGQRRGHAAGAARSSIPCDGSDLLFELLGTVVHDPARGTGIVSVLRNVTDLQPGHRGAVGELPPDPAG